MKLPITCTQFRIQPVIETNVIRLEKEEIFTDQSGINHFYKSPYIVTSAPIKLLSCLNIFIRIGRLDLFTLKTILCCADGTGGFSALMSQCCPRANIIFNSYYEKTNQSPMRCDKYIPAALAGNKSKT